VSFGQDKAASDAAMISKINEALAKKSDKKSSWVAGETSVSVLSKDEWKYRVGVNFQPISVPPLQMERLAAALPSSIDWRSHGGSFVTAIKNQGSCGSCWAFSMAGALESYAMRTENKPGANIDLSEQVMLSCSGVGSCQGGQMDASFIKSPGLPPESYYPYTGTNGSCSSAAAGWQKVAKKVAAWNSVPASTPALKQALVQHGPLPTAFYVYEDFMYYKSGVYTHTTGSQVGAHAVLIVGYDDAGQYFVVKNSWGTGWGENGFFKIAYSQVTNAIQFGMLSLVYTNPTDRNADEYTLTQQRAENSKFSADDTLGRLNKMMMPLFQQSF